MSQYNLPDLLSWSKAKIVKQVGTPLLDEFENVIEWQGIPRGAKELLRQYVLDNLQIITDVTITNTREFLSGPYAAIKVATFDTDSGVTLHVTYDRYYYESWNWGEAELTEPAHLDDTVNFAIFKMKHCNDNKITDILASIPLDFTNQTVHCGQLSGAWHKVKARAIQSDDGRGTVFLYCARSGINVSLYGGTSVFSSHDKFQEAHTDYYYGLVDANTIVLGAGDYAFEDGYTFEKNVSRNDTTGLYDVTIRKMASIPVADTQKVKTITKFDTETQVSERNSEAMLAEETAQVAGQVKTTSSKMNEFGRFDNTESIKEATEVASASTSNKVDAFESSEESVDRNASAAITPSAQVAGTVVAVSSKLNEFGRFDNTTSTVTADDVADATKSKTITTFVVENHHVDRNATSAVAQETAQTQGTIKTTTAKLNEFLRYDNTVEQKDAVPRASASLSKDITAFSSKSSVLDKHQSSPVTQQTDQAPGTVVTTKSELNEYGLFENLTDTKTAILAENAETANFSGFAKTTLYESIESHKNKNETAQPSLPAFSAGTIVKLSSTENEFQRYDNETATITANEVLSADSVVSISASSIEERTVSKNTTPATQPTTTEDGVVKRVKNEKNDFGLYDTDTVVDTAQEIDSGVVSFATDNGTGWTRTVENADSTKITEVAASVTSGSVSVSPTQYPGRFNIHANNRPASGSGTGADYELGFTESTDMLMPDKDRIRVDGTLYKYLHWQQLVTTSRIDANAFVQGGITPHAIPTLTNNLLITRASGFRTSVAPGRRVFVAMRVYVGSAMGGA